MIRRRGRWARIRRQLLGITTPAEDRLQQLEQRLQLDVGSYMAGFDSAARRIGYGVLPWQREIIRAEYENRRRLELEWIAANPSIGKGPELA